MVERRDLRVWAESNGLLEFIEVQAAINDTTVEEALVVAYTAVIGRNVRKLRLARDITLEEMSKGTGIPVSNLQMLEGLGVENVDDH
jgi:hypothetical protein|tara:strand:+ start:1279 stop:1539 length:261 start_codon:yes stop_codon:yes gene_type:complete